MELVNLAYNIDLPARGPHAEGVLRHAAESAVLLLSPIVPHFAEEIWHLLGHRQSILLASWPRHREDALVQDEVTVVVQVNGKLRNRFVVALDTDKETLQQMAVADEKVAKFIEGKTIRKVIVIPNKLVNIVV
jgi:leucyl-tRNA synthetase